MVVAAGIGILGAGMAIGMLVAPRLGRWLERDEEPDDD